MLCLCRIVNEERRLGKKRYSQNILKPRWSEGKKKVNYLTSLCKWIAEQIVESHDVADPCYVYDAADPCYGYDAAAPGYVYDAADPCYVYDAADTCYVYMTLFIATTYILLFIPTTCLAFVNPIHITLR